jgi:hypothetical protein
MGVDFTGYSCVQTTPLPTKYRPVKTMLTPADIETIKASYRAMSPDIRCLAATMDGYTLDRTGNVKVSPYKTVVASDALCEEYYEQQDDQDLIGVVWKTGLVFRKTSETESCGTARSYSGYSDFCEEIRHLSPMTDPYFPPSTDVYPYYGIIPADKCAECLQTLDLVRDHFVPRDWTPCPEYSEKTRFTRDTTWYLHPDSWFFCEFYSALTLAANAGVLCIH